MRGWSGTKACEGLGALDWSPFYMKDKRRKCISVEDGLHTSNAKQTTADAETGSRDANRCTKRDTGCFDRLEQIRIDWQKSETRINYEHISQNHGARSTISEAHTTELKNWLRHATKVQKIK